MLQKLLHQSPGQDPEKLDSLALKMAGLLPADIQGIVADSAAKAVVRKVNLQAFCSPGTYPKLICLILLG